MNSNFNRQFIMIDFRLLDNREFLKFIGASEFATYLVLRRNVWRGIEPHYMGLNKLYEENHILACSLEREKISEITGVHADNISRHLKSLEEKGVIRIVKTGRQNIFTLGEWVDVNGDSSYRGVEWFYLEGVYGVTKSDLTVSVRPETTKTSDQNQPLASAQNRLPQSDQTRRSASDSNIYINTEENKTITNGDKNISDNTKLLIKLPTIKQPKEKVTYLVEYIVGETHSKHSRKFYELVASKVPEDEIRRALSEIKVDGADSPAAVFTYRMNKYALGHRQLSNTSV